MAEKIADFTIEYTQYLKPDGQLSQTLPDFIKSPQQLVDLYRLMVLTRTFDTKAIALQRTGKLGTYASSLGQEAIGAAIGDRLQAQDVFCPYYREYATQFQRGVKMSEIFQYWGGDERGNNYAAQSDDLPICVPIASQCLLAVGIASAIKYRKQKRVVIVTCGDGATSKGDFYEAINVAGAWHLPIVFIVNNNQWAISVPRKLQTSCKTIAQKAIAGGISGEQADGNDIVAMLAVVDKAIHKARTGGGPSLIEAITYRICDHTTADDARRYTPEGQFDQAKAKEPFLRLRTYLQDLNAWDAAKEQQLLKECSEQVEAAVKEYQNMPAQPPEAMFDFMYEQLPDDLKEQREQAIQAVKNKGVSHG